MLEDRNRVEISVGTDELLRTTADLNRRIDDNGFYLFAMDSYKKKVGMRRNTLNAAADFVTAFRLERQAYPVKRTALRTERPIYVFNTICRLGAIAKSSTISVDKSFENYPNWSPSAGVTWTCQK